MKRRLSLLGLDLEVRLVADSNIVGLLVEVYRGPLALVETRILVDVDPEGRAKERARAADWWRSEVVN